MNKEKKIKKNQIKNKQIIVAPNAGFCFGVKRAVELVEKTLENNQKKAVYSLGELVHNHQVIAKLEKRGLKTVQDLSEIPSGAVMIIRSHGAPAEIIELAKNRGIEVVDATCPFVEKARKVAADFFKNGLEVVICGDKKHAEIIGINSLTDYSAKIVNDVDEVKKIIFKKNKIGVLSQTTYKLDLLKEVTEALLDLGKKSLTIENTICLDSANKKVEAKKIAQKVDAMIVVGGKTSSNTTKLAEIGRAVGVPTYHIETVSELEKKWFNKAKKIGITAGASTAQFSIDEVVGRIGEVIKVD